MRPADIAWFLDFDHTLFNTDEFFHVDLRRAFSNLGLASVSWEQGYARAWQAGYSLERHAEEMFQQSGSQPALLEMKRIVQDSFSDLKRYLFPDVVPFLEGTKRKGVALYLLSFGNPEWQRYKVLGAGIGRYFDSIFFTAQEGGKAEVIVEHARGVNKVLMVDNNPNELDLVRDAAPAVTTYCINRVPPELTVSHDELSRLRFFDAREYLGKPWRYEHVRCTALDDLLGS